jgi:predicted nucleotidyltransferase
MAYSKAFVINLIRLYIDRLKENNIPVERVLLFGSYMKETPREDSDIDIAVISSAFKGDRYLDRRRIVPLRRGIDSRIEPIPFTPGDYADGSILIDEIKSTGQEIGDGY